MPWIRDSHGNYFDRETGTRYNSLGIDYFGFRRNGIHYNTGTKRDSKGFDQNGWNERGINRETGTEFDKHGWNIHGFNFKGINRETGTKWDKNGYDIDGNNKNSVNNDYSNKASKQEFNYEENAENKKTMIEENIKPEDDLSYFSYNGKFDFDFFNTDLERNKPLIKSDLERRWNSKKAHITQMDDLRESLENAISIEERNEIKQEIYIANYASTDNPPEISETLNDPYFFFCTDDNFTYISNKNINIVSKEKRIMPFTFPRAHLLRFGDSGFDKHEVIIHNGKLISTKDLGGKRAPKAYSIDIKNIKTVDEVINERKRVTGGEKQTGIGDISKMIEADQNSIMSAPAEGVTLITGVAGSGKTNILLHRIQYLLWEQPGKENEDDVKFHQDKMLFLCYNKSLQKYIQSSINNKFPEILVKTVDQWMLDIFRESFPNKNISFEDNVNFSANEIQKLNDSIKSIDINDLYIETGSDVYEYKEGKNKKKVRTCYISLNPIILEKLLGKSTQFTKKHILIWLYLLSLTSIRQDGAQTFSLKIGDIKYPSIKISKYSNDSIDYIFKKSVYDHIFIDEAQDLSKIQMKIINGFHKNSMTIAGDESQLLTAGTLTTDLSEYFGINIDNEYTLSTSYRSSQQTALFANEFLKKVKVKNSIGSISFKGLKPIVKKVENIKDEYEYLINKIESLREESPDASICIIYPKNEEALKCVNYLEVRGIDAYLANGGTWDFSKSIHVSNYFQAKGLEFDYIFICGINEFDSRNKQNKNNVIFTLVTRGIKRVYMIARGGMPSLLDGVDTDTYILQ